MKALNKLFDISQEYISRTALETEASAGNFWMKINQKHLVYFEKWFIFGLFLVYFWFIFEINQISFKSFGHSLKGTNASFISNKILDWQISLYHFTDWRVLENIIITVNLQIVCLTYQVPLKGEEGIGGVLALLREVHHILYLNKKERNIVMTMNKIRKY